MHLPNKLYRYNESVFVDMIEILKSIEHPIGVYDLYKKVKKQVVSLEMYIEALDCLYLLEKISFDTEGGTINVNRN